MELLKIPNSSSNFEREKQSWWHHTFWFQNIVKMKVSQSYPTLCDPMDYTVHGILQAKLLEWVAFPFSRGSPNQGDQTQVSCIAGRFFTSWATREAPNIAQAYIIKTE